MNKYDSLLENGVIGLVMGVFGFLLSKVISFFKEVRGENRLDQAQVAETLQDIIDDLREECRRITKDRETCLVRASDQEQEIKILWYNVKKLRDAVANLKRENGHKDGLPPLLPPRKDEQAG